MSLSALMTDWYVMSASPDIHWLTWTFPPKMQYLIRHKFPQKISPSLGTLKMHLQDLLLLNYYLYVSQELSYFKPASLSGIVEPGHPFQHHLYFCRKTGEICAASLPFYFDQRFLSLNFLSVFPAGTLQYRSRWGRTDSSPLIQHLLVMMAWAGVFKQHRLSFKQPQDTPQWKVLINRWLVTLYWIEVNTALPCFYFLFFFSSQVILYLSWDGSSEFIPFPTLIQSSKSP